MDADAQRLAAEEDVAWAALHAAFAQVPSDRFEEARLTADGWSPKDAMFHVGAWCAEAAIQLERIRLGTYVDLRIDVDAQNGEWAAISKGLDLGTVKSQLHAARTRMRQEWCELCELGTPTSDAVEWFEESGQLHYGGHARDLLTWLNGG